MTLPVMIHYQEWLHQICTWYWMSMIIPLTIVIMVDYFGVEARLLKFGKLHHNVSVTPLFGQVPKKWFAHFYVMGVVSSQLVY